MSKQSQDLVFDLSVRCDGEWPPRLESKNGRWQLKSHKLREAKDKGVLKGKVMHLEFWCPPWGTVPEVGDMRYLRVRDEDFKEGNEYFAKLLSEGPPETDWNKGSSYHKGDYVRVKHPHKFQYSVYYCWRSVFNVYDQDINPQLLANWIHVANICMKSEVDQ